MSDALVGSYVGRYKILECVHKSEIICFYKAYDTKLDRNVFMKTIVHSSEYSQESIDYFLSEAKILAKLSHPGIAKILDFGYEGDTLYLVSEHVQGKLLSELLVAPMNYKDAIDILLPLTDALAYAHSKGVLHRDLKPENIIINQDNAPILNDFSLLRILENEETKDITGTNIGLGSPAYISPEQGKGMPAEFRSDIYSLGIIFFEIVTGQKPFQSQSSMEIVIQHVTSAPPRPSSLVSKIPQSVDDAILMALAKKVNDRYQNMEQFAEALRKLAADEYDQYPKPGRVVSKKIMFSALLLFLLVGFSLSVWFSQSQNQNLTPATEQAITTNFILETPVPTLALVLPTEEAVIPPIVQDIQIEPMPILIEYSLSDLPVLSNKIIPDSNKKIDLASIAEIIELARWGTPQINQVAFIDDTKILLAATSAGLYYFESSTLEPLYLIDTGGWLSALAVSKDEQWVATGDISGKIKVWNIYNGEMIAELLGHAGEIISMDFSTDSAKLVSTAMDNTVRVWDISQNKQTYDVKKFSFRINKVAFFYDKDLFMTGGDDFQITIWDGNTGELVDKISSSQKINDLAISSDNTYVALALNSATVEIWDISRKEIVNSIKDWQITYPYTSISFLPNNQLVLLGSTDGITRIWNIFSGQKIWETPRQEKDGLSLGTSPIKMVNRSIDGTKNIVLSGNRQVEIWSITPNQQLQIVKEFPFYGINRLVLSPNNETLAYQSENLHVNIISTTNHTQISQIIGRLPKGNPFSSDNTRLLIENKSLNYYSVKPDSTEFLYSFYEPPFDSFVNFLDENKIVATARAGIIKYWSTSSGRELTPQVIKQLGNCRVIYRLDASFLVAGSLNGVLTDDENLEYFCKISRGPRVISSKFLKDGRITAFSLENQTFEIWNIAREQKFSLKSEAKGHMLDVAISQDGTLLAVASASGVVEVYDAETEELLKILHGHTAPVNALFFSEDQKYLVSGSNDGTVRFWGLQP